MFDEFILAICLTIAFERCRFNALGYSRGDAWEYSQAFKNDANKLYYSE